MAKKSTSLDQREARLKEQLEKIAVKRQIASLKEKLKGKK